MIKFDVYEKFELKKEDACLESICRWLRRSLSYHFYKSRMTIESDKLILNGSDLIGFWERSITFAKVDVKIEGNHVTLHVEGYAVLGMRPWIFSFLGSFTGIFFVVTLLDIVKYFTSKDRPKQYFKEAFESVKFRFG